MQLLQHDQFVLVVVTEHDANLLLLILMMRMISSLFGQVFVHQMFLQLLFFKT